MTQYDHGIFAFLIKRNLHWQSRRHDNMDGDRTMPRIGSFTHLIWSMRFPGIHLQIPLYFLAKR
jgi:hypothetical protein